MRRIPYIAVTVIFISALLLAGCNLPFLASQQDTAGVQTAAAQTVQAQIGPATATFTPVPFPTLPQINTLTAPTNTLAPAATATSICDAGHFVTDVTIPDDTPIAAGDAFTKTWRVQNVGTCSWTPSYAVVFVSGTSMNGPAVQALTGNVNPGQNIDLSVSLTAPTANGNYTGNWGIRNAAGVIFANFWVKIVVGSGTSGPFAVTSVSYSLSTWSDSSHTNCPRMTASITTNGAGTVTYHWTRSDNSTSSPATLTFSSAGSQSVNYDWALGSANAGSTSWVGIYIDDPNHQDFGHKSFTTACTSP